MENLQQLVRGLIQAFSILEFPPEFCGRAFFIRLIKLDFQAFGRLGGTMSSDVKCIKQLMKGFLRSPKCPEQRSHKGEARSGSSVFCLTLFRALQLRFAGLFPFYVVFQMPRCLCHRDCGQRESNQHPQESSWQWYWERENGGKIPNLNVLYRDLPKGMQRRKQYGGKSLSKEIFYCVKVLLGMGRGS